MEAQSELRENLHDLESKLAQSHTLREESGKLHRHSFGGDVREEIAFLESSFRMSAKLYSDSREIAERCERLRSGAFVLQRRISILSSKISELQQEQRRREMAQLDLREQQIN